MTVPIRTIILSSVLWPPSIILEFTNPVFGAGFLPVKVTLEIAPAVILGYLLGFLFLRNSRPALDGVGELIVILQSQGGTRADGAGAKSYKEWAGVLPKLSGVAGIVGPVAFVVTYTVFGLSSPGYSQLTQAISNLELVQNGWIQQLNFLQCGSMIIVFALGFRHAMQHVIKRRLGLASVLLVLSGAGMIDASYFTPAKPIEHTLGFLFFIIPLTATFFLVGRELLREPGWRGRGIYSLVSGLVTAVLLLIFFSLGASESFGFIGLINRLFVVESLAWLVVFAARLIGVKR